MRGGESPEAALVAARAAAARVTGGKGFDVRGAAERIRREVHDELRPTGRAFADPPRPANAGAPRSRREQRGSNRSSRAGPDDGDDPPEPPPLELVRPRRGQLALFFWPRIGGRP